MKDLRVKLTTWTGETVFESSTDFLLFDQFRIPYRIASSEHQPWLVGLSERHPLRGCGELSWRQSEPSRAALRWPRFEGERSPFRGSVRPGSYRLGSVHIHGCVLPDDVCGRWLNETQVRWSKSTPILSEGGKRVASEWRGDDGSRFLPYDPSEVIRNYWSEAYLDLNGSGLGASAKRVAMPAYYWLRPMLPRAIQLWMRRLYSKVQVRTQFPRWPLETALHDFYALLLRHATDAAGEAIPSLAPWPNGHSWALVLTHDVETAVGYENMRVFLDLEREHGYRSSWNFVPKRYAIEDVTVEGLKRDGFEVGIHGLYHDGRDLESLRVLAERLPMIREYANRWHAVGFRSPATHRQWALMPLLGFDYDSSYPDTDPFEPQSGGCCTWLPYFNQDMVELPITLPQDHTLFEILQEEDGRRWIEKAEHIRREGGMALLITHPDYALTDRPVLAYRALLERFATDGTAWRALPWQVSMWWRRRAASRLEQTASGWRVVGPAASEASIVYLGRPPAH